jgi:Uma2 family endonuclease
VASDTISTVSTTAIDPGVSVDQRVLLHGVQWRDYEALLAMRGESSGVRIAYLEGVLELTSPSRDHERIKTKLARLVETYSDELGLGLEGYGSWTLKKEKEERGLEPDECYSIGHAGEGPDLAIEVVWTAGGLDRLEIYRGLGVREVWVWRTTPSRSLRGAGRSTNGFRRASCSRRSISP